MQIIGVTGKIGSGKSSFCKALASLGVPIYDCDSRAKALYDENAELRAWVEKEILDGQEFKRNALAERIFSNPALLSELEAKVFEKLYEDFIQWCKQCKEADHDMVIVESAIFSKAPALLECLDTLIIIEAKNHIERAALRDSTSKESVENRASSQPALDNFPSDIKIIRISNDGSLADLHNKALKILSSIIP